MVKKIFLFILFVFSIVLMGCKDPVTSMEVTKKGKTEYYVGETFDPTGYVLTIKIDDEAEELDLTLEMTNVNGPFDEAGQKEIIVNYSKEELTFNTKFKVEVINKRLTSITVKEYGKVYYDLNESFDPSKFTIECKYEDNTIKEIELSSDMVDGFDSSTIGEKELTVKYEENGTIVTCKFNVTIDEIIKIESLELKSKGKEIYNINEVFNPSGFVLEAKYEDGSILDINLTNDMIVNTLDFSTLGKKEINVKYVEKGLEYAFKFAIEVIEKSKPVSLNIIEYGETTYTLEKEFTIEGFKFEVVYSDGSTAEVDNNKVVYEKYVYDENSEDEDEIINIPVSYTIDGVTLELSIETRNIAEWYYEEYIGKKEAEIMFVKIYEDLQALIPAETTENIPLPKSTDYGLLYILRISSSDTNIMSPTGIIDPKEEDMIVQIKVTIDNDYKTETYTWDIIVKGLGPVVLRPWNESEKHVFAYFYEGTSNVMSETDAYKVDVINYCFARVQNGLCNIDSLRYLKENMKLRRSTGVRIVLSIGGGGSGSAGFSDACLTDEGRAKFVESIMNIVKEYSFDGIDLDWEYPAWTGLSDSRPEDKNNFTKLCKELRVALDEYKEGMLLTSAMIGGINVERFYDLKELNNYLDYFHLMTYDLNSSGLTTHHSNTLPGNRVYSARNAMQTYMAGGVDAEKIVIGAAFYGKISTLATPTTADSSVLLKPIAKKDDGTDDTRTIQYTKIKEEYMTNPSFVRLFDESTASYYLTDGKVFITYDDPEAFAIKADLIKNNNLGGIMFWDYGSDSTGTLLFRLSAEIDRINQGR